MAILDIESGGARLLIFFGYFFGLAFALPMSLGLYLQSIKNPPYQISPKAFEIQNGEFASLPNTFGPMAVQFVPLKGVAPNATAAAMAVHADGTWSVAMNAETSKHFIQSWQGIAAHLGIIGKSKKGETGLEFQTNTGMHGLIYADEKNKQLLAFMAATPDLALNRMKENKTLIKNQQKTMGNIILEDNAHWVGLFIAFWALIQFPIFPRVVSWSAEAPAKKGVSPLSYPVLLEKIQKLGQDDGPLMIKKSETPNEIFVEWKYEDSRWASLSRPQYRKKLYRLALRFDEQDKKVRAVEQWTTFDAITNAQGANVQWTSEQGITLMRYEVHKEYAWEIDSFGMPIIKEGRSYTFDLNGLKTPIIQAITSAGWNYSPVLTFFRPLGG